MKISLYARLVLWLTLTLAGCAGSIDSKLLEARLASPVGRPLLIDVRTGSEYAAGHLPGAVHIPFQVLPFRLSEVVVGDRSEPVVVYCAHGPRAGVAGFFLGLAGFTQVMHLEGDIRSWRDQGGSLVNGLEPGLFGK